MAVIRDIMPAFELYQPASVEDALGCWTGTEKTPG